MNHQYVIDCTLILLLLDVHKQNVYWELIILSLCESRTRSDNVYKGYEMYQAVEIKTLYM